MIFNTLLKRTIGAGGMDGILEVDHLPQPSQEGTPDGLWIVMEGQVIDIVLSMALEGGVSISCTIVDDHTAVSSPESISDDGSIQPVYIDTTDAWIYIREGHPMIPDTIPTSGWTSWSQLMELQYNGIVDTVPTVDMTTGIYAIKGKEEIEGDPIEKNSVYKATTYKDVTTLYVVKDGEVINVTELKANEGVEVEIETLWYNDPSNIPNPIATTDTKMHIYFLLDCHLWTYDGTEWTDWGMTEYGLTHTNAVITEPPTADMTEGFYTLDSQIVDNIHFGITFTDSEVSRLAESETCAIYMVAEGMTVEVLEILQMQGQICLGYKIIKDQSEFDTSDTEFVYVDKSTNVAYFYLDNNWAELSFTVLESNDSIPSTEGGYCYYKVEQKWENPYAEIANLDAEIANLKEKLSEEDGADNFMNYAELTVAQNVIELDNISNKSIRKIEIHPSITLIGEGAFRDCTNLTSVVIPHSITTIGVYAFANCDSLTSVVIPDSVTSIGYHAFSDCDSLTSIEIPHSVTTISNYAFQSCSSLTSVVIEDGVNSIGNNAFQSCTNLTSVVIPDSVTTIGNYAFQSCSSLTSVVISDSVTTIGTHAFYGCSSLTSVVIPDSVNLINVQEFRDCHSLTSVVIPNSITLISEYAFYNCYVLTDITYNGTQEQWNAITKQNDWNTNTGAYTIHCTDGDIAKE